MGVCVVHLNRLKSEARRKREKRGVIVKGREIERGKTGKKIKQVSILPTFYKELLRVCRFGL